VEHVPTSQGMDNSNLVLVITRTILIIKGVSEDNDFWRLFSKNKGNT
jgi:hypothetical protein